MVSVLNKTPQRLWTSGGDNAGFAVLAGRDEGRRQIQILMGNYQVSSSLMGPMNLNGEAGNTTEEIAIKGSGPAAGTITFLDRYLPADFQFQKNEGYNLSIKNIPIEWGDLEVKQYRLDKENDMTIVNAMTITRKDRVANPVVTIPGKVWMNVDGAAQGLDLIVITQAQKQRSQN